MIVLSLLLVVTAVALIAANPFVDGLTLAYLAIGSSLASLVSLAAAVLLRRGADPVPVRVDRPGNDATGRP
ncbi:hypothetical protein [Egicoccus halophilus]|nr:hypothetical protein [Egicoccus halophilus]